MEKRISSNNRSPTGAYRSFDSGVGTLYIRRLKALSTQFAIYDKHDSLVYSVKPKKIALSRTFSVFDANEEPVAQIAQCLSLIVPKYRIRIEGGDEFVIKRKLSFSHDYLISSLPWTVLGDYSSFRYNVLDGNENVIFRIKKSSDYSFGRYEVEYTDARHKLHGVCIALAIDAAIAAIRNSR